MRKVDLLRDLQELDSALDRAREELEQRRVRLGDDGELVPLREELEVARKQLRSLLEKGKELELKLEADTARVKDEEKKLYGGTVKNPKDLGNLAQEVEHEKARLSRLEDEVLLNMDAREAAGGVVRTLERDCAAREAEWKAEQQRLQGECESLERQDLDLTAQRETLVAGAEAASLKSYDLLRRTRGGIAVVPIEQRTCRGCRITLSSSEVQRARSSTELVTCQSCGRILYTAG